MNLIQANEFLLRGTIALADLSRNGAGVDVDYLRTTTETLKNEIRTSYDSLEDTDEGKAWRCLFGIRTNFDSRRQLQELMYSHYKHRKTINVKKDKAVMDATALENIGTPFALKYLAIQKKIKALSTYIEPILLCQRNGRVHPFFQILLLTYRSSSNRPNFQNIPKRNPVIGKMIRKAYIPRKGWQLVELDYSQLEVRIAACYHKDPTMIQYIEDKTTDMHRDSACDIFMIEKQEVSKTARDISKNAFVFPQFYGSVYTNCAANIWKRLVREEVKLEGTSLRIVDHLKTKGIDRLGKCDMKLEPEDGTFEKHLAKAQDVLWNQRFPRYTEWKKNYWNTYLQKGYFQMKTGFVCSSLMFRNDVTNYPVQGCLQGHAKVLTKEFGLIPIEELVRNSEKPFHTWTGFKWASAKAIEKGMWQAARVQLSSGIVIDCDTRHKFKNEKNQWVAFKDLKVGDNVALPSTSFIECPEPSKKMTWMFILGFILGDGSLNAKRGSVCIRVGEVKSDEVCMIASYLKDEMGVPFDCYSGGHLRVNYARKHRSQKYTELTLQNEIMRTALKKAGMSFEQNAHTKRVPASVWKASLQERRDFLQGLFRSDGSRGDTDLYALHMCNKELLLEIQTLASSVGIDSFLAKTATGWKLRFSWMGVNKKPFRKIPTECFADISIPSQESYEVPNERITEKRVLASAQQEQIPISQYVGERILKRCDVKEIYRYDQVVAIEVLDKQVPTYTLSVDDPLHQFVADGVITKNSAFHCLLLSILILQDWLKKRRMKTRIIGEIHDALIAECPPNEKDEFLHKARQVMTQVVAQQWPWIIVPLEVEAEVCGIDASWADHSKYSF